MRPRIYVAAPLNGPAVEYIKNVHKMIAASEKIRRLGFAVLVPCLDKLTGIMMGDLDYSDYFDNNAAWIPAADAVYFCEGYENSDGCMKEMRIALDNEIPTYFDIDVLAARFADRLERPAE